MAIDKHGGSDYKTAIEELLKASQNDAFIQRIIGQSYEKLVDEEMAGEYCSNPARIAHKRACGFQRFQRPPTREYTQSVT